MEWLSLIANHQLALHSLQQWLLEKSNQCAKTALDIPLEDIPTLRGERNAYLSILAYINNNLNLVKS